jgi:hypothetical protein
VWTMWIRFEAPGSKEPVFRGASGLGSCFCNRLDYFSYSLVLTSCRSLSRRIFSGLSWPRSSGGLLWVLLHSVCPCLCAVAYLSVCCQCLSPNLTVHKETAIGIQSSLSSWCPRAQVGVWQGRGAEARLVGWWGCEPVPTFKVTASPLANVLSTCSW